MNANNRKPHAIVCGIGVNAPTIRGGSHPNR
jgi:hypothetical protein